MTTIRLRELATLLSCNNRTIWRIYQNDYYATWHDKMDPEIDIAKFASLVNSTPKIFLDVINGKDRFLNARQASAYVKTNTLIAFYVRKYPPAIRTGRSFYRWTERTLRKSHERKYGK